MDREIWKIVMQAVQRAARAVKDPSRRRPRYPHWLIVAMYFWSLWHDRCLSWACDKSHYGDLFRPRKLPSRSRFTRRIASPICQEILRRVHQDLMGCGVASDCGFFDGRALTVSPVSKDRDAKRGKISGGYAKGYKLHAFVTDRGRIAVWSVMPLNCAEQSVALELCPYLPPPPSDGLVMADSNYDSAPLHKALAPAQRLLLTPLKGQNRVQGGQHHQVTLRQMGEQRRAAVMLWKEHAGLARLALKARIKIENVFSVLTCACGLGPPPPWVRTLPRVRRWVGGKIILYHARLTVQERAAA